MFRVEFNSDRANDTPAGIVATYNGSNRAFLDAWSRSDVSEWRFASRGTTIETDELGFFQPYTSPPGFPPNFEGALALCARRMDVGMAPGLRRAALR